jgi:hypothetical protein
MKLYLLEVRVDRPDTPDPWSDYLQSGLLRAIVVRAEDEDEARQLARTARHAGVDNVLRTYPGFAPWRDPLFTSCVELSPDGPQAVLFTSYLH